MMSDDKTEVTETTTTETPAETPAEVPASKEEVSSSDLFSEEDMISELLADELDDPAPPPATPEPAPTLEAEETPTPEPRAPVPQEEPASAQPPVAQPPQPSSEELNTQYQQFFERSVDLLAEKVYAFDDETKEMLDSEPSKVLPKLAARLHMQVLTAATTQLANMLPQAMGVFQDRNQTYRATEDKFFESFPQLRGKEEDVKRIAVAYRQANPQVPLDQAVQEIGTMSMVALRLPLGTEHPQTQATQPPVSTVAKGAMAPAAPAKQSSVWDELIETE